ncbi:oxidoreductase-like domain-containing protein [Kinneretia aquatilis]|nr:oxidoreductase-like domain-containing protein [Paucibacter aquatile]
MNKDAGVAPAMADAANAASAANAADPRPEPPVAPDLDACCGNGCDPCIFDLHDLAMDQYRQALRAWEARQRAQ